MTEEEILNTLDHHQETYYGYFVELGHVYSYLIDTRLNVFRADDARWAIAIERLGYNPRAGSIILDIHYFGNCLTNLEYYNGKPTGYYNIYPIDQGNFEDTVDGECLKADAKYWLVRGQQVSLSHNKQDYLDAGIELKEYEPNAISVEEAGRLVILGNRELFRATDDELYRSIPADLKKILVLDEWFHKDFLLHTSPTLTDEQLLETYVLNKNLNDFAGFTFESFAQSFRQQEIRNDEWKKEAWENDRPSSYETWQQIAKVIVTNDTTHYKPTLKANTHWTNWPESGSM